jgi:hypothetical protein
MAQGDLQRIVGANLRRYRDNRDLSQETFAEVLGWHRTYVGTARTLVPSNVASEICHCKPSSALRRA